MDTIKTSTSRGGRRAGAGRPFLELHQEGQRKITKSITLTADQWEEIDQHAISTLSNAIAALLALHGRHNGTWHTGWSEVPKNAFRRTEDFHHHMNKVVAPQREKYCKDDQAT